MSNIFKGKVALVTGAAAGIGLATAKAFADAGAAVVLLDLDKSAVVKAASDVLLDRPSIANVGHVVHVNHCTATRP